MADDTNTQNIEELRHRIKALEQQNAALTQELKWRDELSTARTTLYFRIISFLSQSTLWVLAGPNLYENAQRCWDAWSEWLKGRNTEKPERETRDLLAAFLTRVVRISLIGLVAALLPTIIIAVQVVLLAQQNRLIDLQTLHLEHQTSLLTLEQTSNFRALLRQLPLDENGNIIHDFTHSNVKITKWPKPSKSSIDQITLLGISQPQESIQSLLALLYDSEPTVAAGALTALHFICHLETIRKDYRYCDFLFSLGVGIRLKLQLVDLSDVKLNEANLLDFVHLSVNNTRLVPDGRDQSMGFLPGLDHGQMLNNEERPRNAGVRQPTHR